MIEGKNANKYNRRQYCTTCLTLHGFSKRISASNDVQMVVISANCDVQSKMCRERPCQGGGRCRMPCGGSGKKRRRLALPEQQPDGVYEGPEIVVTINFGTAVEADISEYLSECLANCRQTSKHDTRHCSHG